jgi:hypothetical protein
MIFQGYGSIGARLSALFSHAGPASYTQVVVTPGTVPVTGGDVVQAVDAGLKYFDMLNGGQTDDGAFTLQAIPVSASNQNGSPATTYRLKWIANFTAAFGGQNQVAGTEVIAATNLTTAIARLFATGY